MKAETRFIQVGKKFLAMTVILSMLVAFLPMRTVVAMPYDLPERDNIVFAEPVYTNERPPTPRGFSSLTPITVGHGTAASPYIIYTAYELAWLSEQVYQNWAYWGSPNRHFRLASDIDLSSFHPSYTGVNWMPIGGHVVEDNTRPSDWLGWWHAGTTIFPFYGMFDGAGHSINGLFIDSRLGDVSLSHRYGHGLFGVVGGTIKNLSVNGHIHVQMPLYLVDLDMGGLSIGGIAGYLGNLNWNLPTSAIINSHFKGDIEGSGTIGGIVGQTSRRAVVLNNYSSGSVIGIRNWEGFILHTRIGGIVGVFSGCFTLCGSILSNNISSADVINSCWTAGGIVGAAWGNCSPDCMPSITNNIAMNHFVGGEGVTGRVIGLSILSFLAYNSLDGNRALASMQSVGLPFSTPEYIFNVHNNVNGEDITGPIVSVGTAAGEPSEVVRIPVNLLQNPGIAGFNLVFTYDTSHVIPLDLDDLAIRSSLGGSVFVSNIDRDAGTITVVWAAPYDVDASYLFSLYFEINNFQLNDGETIRTPVSVSIEEMRHANHDDADAVMQNGFVMITRPPSMSLLWGDVNQDGVVDIFDLIRLAQHIAWVPHQRLTGTGLIAANVFYDGRVDISDLIHLAQYLASADMNNPDVVLGPGSRGNGLDT